tara:strand:+ start:2428 stop:3078 length:651 start_codon:yes stop_codon:yes gene_type:complete
MDNYNKQFDITIDGINFVSDEEGMLNLNEIWRDLHLEEKKRPSEWKSKLKTKMINSENIRNKAGRYGFTKATEKATIAYSMFVSDDFYEIVVDSFVELRKGNLLAAAKIADTTQLESKAFNAWLGMEDSTIQQTLRMLGIKRPNFFQKLVKRENHKTSLIERGILKQRNYGSHGVGLRMTSKGKEYLIENRDSINTKVELLYQEQKAKEAVNKLNN